MYCSYWGFTERPFECGSDGRFFFRDEAHHAALLKLRYVVENRRGCGLLAGPSGVGKSMLVGMLDRQLEKATSPVVHVVYPLMETGELLAFIATELTGDPDWGGTPSIARDVRRIREFLSENTANGKHALLVIDEAHLIDDVGTWEALRLLMNFETDGRKDLTMLFAGQTDLVPMMERMPHVEERLAVRCIVRPFEEARTADYVDFRMRQAGSGREVFTPAALHSLHTMTQGMPRQINRLADLALLIGYGEEMESISHDTLEAVRDELLAA